MALSIKDQCALANWIGAGETLANVEAASPIGIAGNVRFTEAARRAYRFIWAWSTVRFEGRAGAAQDRFYRTHGPEALHRRIARVQRLARAYGWKG